MDTKLFWGYVFGLGAFLFMLFASYKLDASAEASIINMLVCVAGGVFGWIAGIFISPHSDERGDFAKISGALMTFVTGFLLAKFEPLLDTQLNGGTALRDTLIWCLLFGVSFGLGALFVFVGRRYWREDAPAQR